MGRQAIEAHLRNEAAPGRAHLLLRGSPLTADAFARSAERTARAYTYDAAPCAGISVELSTPGATADALVQLAVRDVLANPYYEPQKEAP